MKHNEKNVQANLEQAVAGMREQQPEAGTIRAASERVWKNLREEIAAEPRVAPQHHDTHPLAWPPAASPGPRRGS